MALADAAYIVSEAIRQRVAASMEAPVPACAHPQRIELTGLCADVRRFGCPDCEQEWTEPFQEGE